MKDDVYSDQKDKYGTLFDYLSNVYYSVCELEKQRKHHKTNVMKETKTC